MYEFKNSLITLVGIRGKKMILKRTQTMKGTLIFCILVLGLTTSGPNKQVSAKALVMTVAVLTGPAVLDDWAIRFVSFGASVENPLRTLIRTTIAQMAM